MQGASIVGTCSRFIAMKPNGHISGNGLSEVLFEFRRVGTSLRVCAIDPDTRTEVIMIGDPKQSVGVLKRLATRKLIYVMRKKGIKIRGRKPSRSKVNDFEF